jgi:hypothetical protein
MDSGAIEKFGYDYLTPEPPAEDPTDTDGFRYF